MSFDIKKNGNGMWVFIHLLSLHATTNELKNNYIMTINSLCQNFPCEQCKPDFENFIKTHPIQNYKIESSAGLFKWSWELHNFVNNKLHKQPMKYDDALQLYKNIICQNCTAKSILTNNLFLKPIDNHFLSFTSR